MGDMIERVPDNYANRAFLGKEVRRPEFVAGVDLVASSVNKILNPPDEVARKKANGVAAKLVQGLAKDGEWKTDSVNKLVEASRDKNRPANREVSEQRLEVLANGVYIAAKYGDNREMGVALESGSADAIDSLLPESLKGLGERVRNIEITNPEIRKILDGLDRKGRVLKAAGEGGKNKLRENIEKAVEELSEMEGLDDKGDEEMMRVSAYLGAEMDVLGGGESTNSKNLEDFLRTMVEDHDSNSKIIDPRLVNTGNEGGVSGQAVIARELGKYELSSSELVDITRFAHSLANMVRRNPLGWAGGWQQVAPFLSSEVNKKFEGRMGSGEYKKAKEMSEAILTVAMYEAAVFACDETLSSMMQMVPPVESMGEFVWNETYRQRLKDDPVVNSVFQWMFEDAYDLEQKNGGLSPAENLLKSFADKYTIEGYCEGLSKSIQGDKALLGELKQLYKRHGMGELDVEQIGEKVRTAMSLFIVDEYPVWAAHLNQVSRNKNDADDPIWLKKNVVENRIGPDSGETDDVLLFNSNKFGDYKTCVSHPFLSLMYPGNLLRLKAGSYGEEVLEQFEMGMDYVAASQFTVKTKNADGRYVIEGWRRPSEIGGKNINRFNKAWVAFAGDPFGSGFEGYKDFEVGVQQLMNMEGVDRHWKQVEVGWVVSKVLEAKLIAARAANPSSKYEIWAANVALVGAGNISEMEKVVSEFLGADKAGAFGVLRDLKAQYGLRVGTKELVHRIKEFQTGVKGPKAETAFVVNNGSQMLVALVNLASELSGGKPIGGKK